MIHCLLMLTKAGLALWEQIMHIPLQLAFRVLQLPWTNGRKVTHLTCQMGIGSDGLVVSLVSSTIHINPRNQCICYLSARVFHCVPLHCTCIDELMQCSYI